MAERIPIFFDVSTIRLTAAQKQLDITRAKTRRLTKSAGFLNTQFKTLGTTLLATFGAIAVLSAFSNILKSLKDLEFQMSKVAAISGATSKQMVELRNNALKVGAASKFTATEVGKLQEELARLGFTVTEILRLTDAVSGLAIVADRELGPTALAVAKTLNAFRLSAADADRVVNIMAESFANSALDLEKFEAAIRNVGPLARVAGLSLEKTTAILGTFVDNGIEASKAGTDLRRILLNISKAGITLDEALDQVILSTNKVTTSQELFGDRAAVAGVILSENTEKVKNFTASLSDSTREIDRMRRLIEDNLETDLKKLGSAFDSLTQKGGALNSVFRTTVQALTEIIRGNITWQAVINDRIEILNEAIKIQKEEEETLRRIKSTVDAAFDSENIEAYILALEDNINKEEIIEQIRRRLRAITDDLRRSEQLLAEEREEAAKKRLKELQEQRKALIGIGDQIIRNRDFKKLELEELETQEAALDIIFGKRIDNEQILIDNADQIIVRLREQADERQQIRDDELADKLSKLAKEEEITAAVSDLARGLSATLLALGEEDSALRKALFIFEKAAAIANVIIFGQLEIAKIGAQLGVAAPPFQIAAGIRIAASVATIVATTIQGFKEGVIDYQGEGTGTSDSNLVRISKGESIIKASATAKSKELLESINAGRINDELSDILLNNKIMGAGNGDVVNALAGVNSSIKKLPIHQTFFNEHGVSNYILKEHSRIKYLGRKYYHGK